MVRRALRASVGDDCELTLAVALFATGHEGVPEGGRTLWAFVEAVADAVEGQVDRRAADLVRQRLARELRPALSAADPPGRGSTVDRDEAKARSGMRAKVPTDERAAAERETMPAPADDPERPTTGTDLPRLAHPAPRDRGDGPEEG